MKEPAQEARKQTHCKDCGSAYDESSPKAYQGYCPKCASSFLI